MKSRVFLVLAVIGAALVAVRFLVRSGRVSPESLLEWMFRNIEAIRENTDRILERLATPEEAVSVVHGE
jgi:hypothetical protein